MTGFFKRACRRRPAALPGPAALHPGRAHRPHRVRPPEGRLVTTPLPCACSTWRPTRWCRAAPAAACTCSRWRGAWPAAATRSTRWSTRSRRRPAEEASAACRLPPHRLDARPPLLPLPRRGRSWSAPGARRAPRPCSSATTTSAAKGCGRPRGAGRPVGAGGELAGRGPPGLGRRPPSTLSLGRPLRRYREGLCRQRGGAHLARSRRSCPPSRGTRPTLVTWGANVEAFSPRATRARLRAELGRAPGGRPSCSSAAATAPGTGCTSWRRRRAGSPAARRPLLPLRRRRARARRAASADATWARCPTRACPRSWPSADVGVAPYDPSRLAPAPTGLLLVAPQDLRVHGLRASPP